jgi:carbamoyl-phosphate synthase large subunit
LPKRTDLKKIMIIGSGPIVIGQACEFDYSGTQGCIALKSEGYEVVLVNSNPATIMTDPEMGDNTYVEPLTVDIVAAIIEKERPDALLPTLGGQTGLNLSVDLARAGVLDKFGVELIGAKLEAIDKAENRELFRAAMERIGQKVPLSGLAHSLEEANQVISEVGFPAIIRPSFTLGGSGAGVAYNREEYASVVQWGLDMSPTTEILIEESILGWKEYELEVMRDLADNVVIICGIENFDAMGVHTGDSITVAPIQTLTDKEYQVMRDAAIDIIREIGVETGGSNIQFAVHPGTGKMVIIEMNPRVSRSSALASKATGFPIAKIAAKLAVGYTLDEIPNDITKKTPASFEPTIDYVVTKIPRWAFEKFPGSDPSLGTQMKSVGEAMSIGRSFPESLQKGLRSIETRRYGLGCDGRDTYSYDELCSPKFRESSKFMPLLDSIGTPTPNRPFDLRYLLLAGVTVDELVERTKIDPWFLVYFEEIVDMEHRLRACDGLAMSDDDLCTLLWDAKQAGFSDFQLAYLWKSDELTVRKRRMSLGVIPVFKTVDTCAAEFEASTPYHYSTYERPFKRLEDGKFVEVTESEVRPCEKKKIIILGGGPNRIGQGIEFDFCCCHALFALSDDGFETIMVNSNPETVSTDYDTGDRLYFEPLTYEDVMNIIEAEKPEGVIVQFGGQTPLKLSQSLEAAGVKLMGTPSDSIDLAEDRGRFGSMLDELGIAQPPNGVALSLDEAIEVGRRIGYPVLLRPSYVLGGERMEIVHQEEGLRCYMKVALELDPTRPVLVDKFLQSAIEVDVDAISDGSEVFIGGIMEHIEAAGIHSGDSACVLPPKTLGEEILQIIRTSTVKLAHALSVRGLMNIQYAITREADGKDKLWVIEVNPRASRTVPFVSKAIGFSLAKAAARVMSGQTLKELGITDMAPPPYISVKEAVLPFIKFPGVDALLGPEMRSTGEVMGIDQNFGLAFAKSQIAAGSSLPLLELKSKKKRVAFVSVNDRDKQYLLPIARGLREHGFDLLATQGTYVYLGENDIESESVFKLQEGRPNIVDRIKNGDVDWVINTPMTGPSRADGIAIRRSAVENGVPYMTTIAAATAGIEALQAVSGGQKMQVRSLQDYHRELKRS